MKDKYSALKYAGIAVIVIVLLFPVYWMINRASILIASLAFSFGCS